MKVSVSILIIALSSMIWATAGCDRRTASAPPATQPDPWQAQLDEMRKSYESNQIKLMVDWRRAVHDAQAGDLDADKLSQEISDLQQRLSEKRSQLDEWNRQLVAELDRRGLSHGH